MVIPSPNDQAHLPLWSVAEKRSGEAHCYQNSFFDFSHLAGSPTPQSYELLKKMPIIRIGRA